MPFSWQASRTVRVKVLGDSPWILSVAIIASWLSKRHLVEGPTPFRPVGHLPLRAASEGTSTGPGEDIHAWSRLRRPVAARSAGQAGSIPPLSVAVVPAHPGHREGQLLLVPPLRSDVEQVIGAVQHVEAAGIGRIGAIDRAVLATPEGAEAGRFLAVRRLGLEIVLRRLLVRREGDAVVEVEIVARATTPSGGSIPCACDRPRACRSARATRARTTCRDAPDARRCR